MMRCPGVGERYGPRPFNPEFMRHHGAENSALKKSAPSSLTTLKTSESTSIFVYLTQTGRL
jgi:hypothetical protein